MTSHEFAQLLLKFPDWPLCVYDLDEGGHVDVTGFIPHIDVSSPCIEVASEVYTRVQPNRVIGG